MSQINAANFNLASIGFGGFGGGDNFKAVAGDVANSIGPMTNIKSTSLGAVLHGLPISDTNSVVAGSGGINTGHGGKGR